MFLPTSQQWDVAMLTRGDEEAGVEASTKHVEATVRCVNYLSPSL